MCMRWRDKTMKEKSKYSITKLEKKKYVLITKRDLEILNLCKKLERLKLSKNDQILIALIKTQLEKDWRKYLLERLNETLKRYKNRFNE